MDLFSCQLDPETLPEHKKRIEILSPVSGQSLSLDAASESAFQKRLFGEGVLVVASGFYVTAPFDCIVESFAHTANRIRLKEKHGLRLQIQCGMQSHSMHGMSFKRHVKVGQKVPAGEILIEFDLRKMKLALDDPRFAVTILNSDRSKGMLLETKNVTANEDILMSVFV